MLYSYIPNSGIAGVIPSPNASGSLTILSSFTVDNVSYSVTSIGVNAFRDKSLITSVTIPNSVTSIGDDAFRSCTSLTSITIPNSVLTIGNNAFEASGLTTVTIANGQLTGITSPAQSV